MNDCKRCVELEKRRDPEAWTTAENERLRAELENAKADLAGLMLTVHKAREENDAAHARAERAEAESEKNKNLAIEAVRLHRSLIVDYQEEVALREKSKALAEEQERVIETMRQEIWKETHAARTNLSEVGAELSREIDDLLYWLGYQPPQHRRSK